MNAIAVSLCLVASLTSGQPAVLPAPELVWEYDCAEETSGTPVLYPGIESPENIIIIERPGKIISLDGHGQLVWATDLGEIADATPAVGDLDGDGTPEIVTATRAGEVVALDGKGVELWRHPLMGKVQDWSAPVLPDLDGDGIREVICGDIAGYMNCLSGDGKLLWRVKVDPYRVSPAAVALGPEGRAAMIVYGTENDHVVALGPDGGLRWLAQQESQFARTNPTIGDLDGDGDYEVAINTSYNNPNSRLVVLDAGDGALVWDARLNLHGYTAAAIADIEGDGSNEVILPLRSNTIYCFSGDGTERWKTTTGGHAYFWTAAVVDINADGRCEIIGAVRDTNEDGKSWFVLDEHGSVLGAYEMPGGADCAPLVADVDKDGGLDIILSGSRQGLVRCFTFGGKAQGARAPWMSQRYDDARQGCVPLKNPRLPSPPEGRPGVLDAAWASPPTWGTNEVAVSWPDYEGERVVVEVATMDASSRRFARVLDLAPADLPERLPIDLVGPGKHTIRIQVYSPEDWRPMSAWQAEVKLAGFKQFAKEVDASLAKLADKADALPQEAFGARLLLRERIARRQATLDALERRARELDFTSAPNADALLEEIQAFRAGIDMDVALARVTVAANTIRPGAPVAVWEDPNPWDETPALLDDAALSADPTVEAAMYGGEYESRCLCLANIQQEPVILQVRPEESTLAGVLFYEVVETPRANGTSVDDALAHMNQAWTLRIAPGEVRRLWMTFNGKALETGTTDLPVLLLPLGWDDFTVSLTLRAQVDALDLADAPDWRSCNWSSPQRFRGSGLDMSAIAVAREHGMNVHVMGAPAPKCDGRGKLTGKVDWTAFDEDLDLIGPDGVILITGDGVRTPAEVERFGPVHVKAERAWLQQLDAHLAAKDWGRDRWALYPVDEPGLYGGTRIERFRVIASHFREAMPEAPIYANPSGFVTPETMACMVPLVDVWCPEQGMLRRSREMATFFLDTGKPVWCYEAPGDVKLLRPLGYYRANSWMAYQLGLSGTGFWTQLYSGAAYGGNDLFLRQAGSEYGANYAAPESEVISRRWEAYRDGIEDVRAFMMLQAAADAAQSANRKPELVAKAGALLGARIEEATRKGFALGDITRFLRDYEMDYGEVMRMRAEAAALTKALAAE